MNDDRQWLKERGLMHRQRLWQGQQILGRKVHEFAEEAGFSRGTKELKIGADVIAARGTEFTVIAVDGRLEHGQIAGRPTGDSGPNLRYLSGGFMAEDRRVH